jgi:A/G-specific adenine glycosylase
VRLEVKSEKSRDRHDATRRRPRRGAPRLDAVRLAAFRRGLLAWYRRHGRDLPWRRTRDPYAILVSEVMLQQTQVRRVLEFYPRFLRRYPTVEELAAAPEGAVREAWDGLGYYRRAANLQRTARLVAERHGGRFPEDLAELERLPGIGRYTAGALVTFAFGVDAAILDTNAARVLARVFGAGRRRGRNGRLWAIAGAALPPGRGYAFNQAIMDLGALICTARRPACPRCPVRHACRAFARGTPPGAVARAQRTPSAR